MWWAYCHVRLSRAGLQCSPRPALRISSARECVSLASRSARFSLPKREAQRSLRLSAVHPAVAAQLRSTRWRLSMPARAVPLPSHSFAISRLVASCLHLQAQESATFVHLDPAEIVKSGRLRLTEPSLAATKLRIGG